MLIKLNSIEYNQNKEILSNLLSKMTCSELVSKIRQIILEYLNEVTLKLKEETSDEFIGTVKNKIFETFIQDFQTFNVNKKLFNKRLENLESDQILEGFPKILIK